MKFVILILILIVIIVIGAILYFSSYNKISVFKLKMNKAEDIIKESLDKKYKLMLELAKQIKKVIKKKDYLKEFNSLNIDKLTSYELDGILCKNLTVMLNLKEDYKDLNNDENTKILNEISELDQIITANKIFFNKNNNLLIKSLKGYNKLVAKINHINIRTSYEIKEPIN